MKHLTLVLAAGVIISGGMVGGCATSKAPEAAVSKPPVCPAPSVETPPRPAAPTEFVLLPTPRNLVLSGGNVVVGPFRFEQAGVYASALEAALTAPFRAYGEVADGAGASCFTLNVQIEPQAMPHAEGYLLRVEEAGVAIQAHDEAGAFYAGQTLAQLARQFAGSGVLPRVEVEDWPDFSNRGVMLDIARDKVPEMGTLYALVDKLAEWKCNQLQLYTEHTFAYRDHPVVWKDASPMTGEEIEALDAYCRDRYIELVPNQNSFGHMERWLHHEAYKELGEMPGGGSDLCPIEPKSIELLSGMYADLLPHFSSRQCNVGCDETWSLGKGRSKAACATLGVGRVYLNFLLEIYKILGAHGRTMQFWGDIIMQHPELIPELPKDIIAMEWGYEATHPFAEHGKRFAESRIPFYVVPGTSTWNSLVGRTANAVANLRNAAENGLGNGAIGYLITDWGDRGHWQFLPASYLGFGYGAAVSWAYEANKDLSITRALDVHAFSDSAGVMGRLAYDLGNAYQVCGFMPGNSSIFYTLLPYGVDKPLDKRVTAEGLRNTIAYIDKVMAELPKAQMHRDDAALIAREFETSAGLMRLACQIGIARIEAGHVRTAEIPVETRHRLGAELSTLIAEFRTLWLARNRPGGLADSAGRFERLERLLKAPQK